MIDAVVPMALYSVASKLWTVNRAFIDGLGPGGDAGDPPTPREPTSGAAIWGECWPVLAPMVEAMVRGASDRAFHDRVSEQLVEGRLDCRCWSFALSPYHEDGEIVAILAVAVETTRQMRAEAHLSFLLDLSSQLRDADSPGAGMLRLAEALATRLGVAGAIIELDAADGQRAQVKAWPAGLDWRPAVAALATVSVPDDAPAFLDIGDLDPAAGAAMRAAMDGSGFAALGTLRLVRDGVRVAALTMVDSGPRVWREHERQLALDALGLAFDALSRLRVEAGVRAAQDRYALIERIEDVGLFDWIVGTQGFYWSDGVYRMLGSQPGDIEPSGRQFTLRMHPDDIETAMASMTEAVAAGENFITEFRLLGDDGIMRRLQVDARVFQRDDGRTSRVTGLIRDITARRLRDDAQAAETRRQAFLQSLDQQYRAAPTAADVIIASAEMLASYLGAPAIAYVDADPAGAELAGARPLFGATATALPGFNLRRFGAASLAGLRNGEAATLTIGSMSVLFAPVLRDRALVGGLWVEAPDGRTWSPPEIALAEIVAARSGAITERSRAESALKENERLLRAIGAASVDLIYAKDVDGRLTYANPATLAVIGQPLGVALGADARTLQRGTTKGQGSPPTIGWSSPPAKCSGSRKPPPCPAAKRGCSCRPSHRCVTATGGWSGLPAFRPILPNCAPPKCNCAKARRASGRLPNRSRSCAGWQTPMAGRSGTTAAGTTTAG